MVRYDFHVIGIGSSAGGFDPLTAIIGGLPGDVNAAFIIVQHLPIDMPSKLNRILERLTPLSVVAVETIEYVEPGCIYVMAAGNQLRLKDRLISLEERPAGDKRNRTIDECFYSIAQDAGDMGVGIILSGAGYDGLEGAKAIEDRNGLVIVQDPITAEFPLMPQMLIANDHPDYILKPADISRKIIEHISVKTNQS